ncbi:DUF484 family protein [Idiomarina xiamenensis]|uniref:DUF484 domain-containing protein n=1 Tax=Idiomarina xiamenensis 10-D-4 TaxID=740709 RepID=K2KSM6_9GAMM|nr:DUF484 family protein [Idiomarina xiamenensis]EKE80605.1 hypothetical protein A10D4_11621 [Idiomarina xiamenensis 10-D-4]
MNNDSNLSLAPRIDDSVIREYLQENPDFFQRHDDLIAQLNLPHQQKGAVSLVERQQQKLRERVRELEEEITELMVNARRNEELFKQYSELYVKLLHSRDLDEVAQSLRQTFAEKLAMPALSLKFFDSPLELGEQYAFAADTHKQLLSKRFTDDSIYLGRLTQNEQRLLFQDEAIASVALLLLGRQGELGMLAIGSHDPSHFEPAMDQLLISQLQALLSVTLPGVLGVQRD